MEPTPSSKDLSPSDLSLELGRRIVHLRKMLGLRQNVLASQARLRPQRLSNIERGIHMPRIDELARLSRILGISLDELVFGPPHMTRLTLLAAQLESVAPAEDLAAFIRHLETLVAGYAARRAAGTAAQTKKG
jgi:transcriptional regulator with XRE-family HTH domain